MAECVSVIVPTIGRIPYLENCIRSLCRQSKKPDEILIVDNSPDKRARLVFDGLRTNRVPLRYLHEPRQGAAYARNTGIRKAACDLIAFIDDDCTADNRWLSELTKAHRRHPAAFIRGVNRNGLPDNFFATLNYYKEEMFIGSGFRLATGKNSAWLDSKNFLVSRTILARYHLQFRHYAIYQDIDFSLQILKSGAEIATAPRAVVCHFNRSGLLPSLHKWILLGIDRRRFQQAWVRRRVIIYQTPHKTASEKTVEKKLSPVWRGKGLWYRIRFWFWYRISVYVTNFSYRFS